jgi:hypothetical protein
LPVAIVRNILISILANPSQSNIVNLFGDKSHRLPI